MGCLGPTLQSLSNSSTSCHMTCWSDSLKNPSMCFGVLGRAAMQLTCSYSLLPSQVMTSLIKGLTPEFSVVSFLMFLLLLAQLPTHFPTHPVATWHCATLRRDKPFPGHTIFILPQTCFHKSLSRAFFLTLVFGEWWHGYCHWPLGV